MSAHIKEKVTQLLNEDLLPLLPPVTALTTLQNAIEFVDESAANRIFELVSWYQVWSARLGSILSLSGSDFSTGVYDSALSMHFSTSLFEYGRNEEDEAPGDAPTRSEMISALKASVGHVRFARERERFSDVMSTIERRHPSSQDRMRLLEGGPI